MTYAPQSTSTQLDMMMLRNSESRTWHFYYKLPTDATYIQGTGGQNSLADTALTAYSGWNQVRGLMMLWRTATAACATPRPVPRLLAGQLARRHDRRHDAVQLGGGGDL
jgi:hypothetical protein